jgi:hypothetical protein
MSRKQVIILVVLFVSALIPVFSGGGRSVPTDAPVSEGTLEGHFNESNVGEGQDNEALGDAKQKLFQDADRALLKLASVEELPVIDDTAQASPSGESTAGNEPHELSDIPVNQLPQSASDSIEKTEFAPVAVPTSLPSAPTPNSAKENPPQVASDRGERSSAEMEKLKLQVASLESKLEEQRKVSSRKLDEVQNKLDVAQGENVKLSHQLQAAEMNSADRLKLSQRADVLQLEIGRLKSELSSKQKIIDESKNLKADHQRLISEEQKIRKSVEQQLEAAIRARDEQIRDNEKLRRAVGDFEKRIKLLEEQRLAESEEKDKVLMKQVANLRKELATAQSSLEELKKKQKTQAKDLSSAEDRVEELQKQLDSKQKVNDELSLRVAEGERAGERARELERQYLSVKNELLLSQEQVKALLSTSKNPVQQQQDYPQRSYQIPERPPVERVPPRYSGGSSDTLIVEVTAAKAVLRAGPGEEHSPVMEIQGGSKLTVETREGDWYRIITPKGQKAYIRVDLTMELDDRGRPRYRPTSAPTSALTPAPMPTRYQRSPKDITRDLAPPVSPDSDPLAELLNRQLREREKKAQQEMPFAASGDASEATSSQAPTEEEEMEAFDALKKGFGKN